ncbi:MAG TPA: lysyl oxidase family protein [Thermoanaerobaculia bacterium]
MSRNRCLFICLILSALAISAIPAAAQGMADMIVRTEMTEQQWVVRDEKLDASFCSVIEGGVTPGLRRLVRFTVGTANIGDADIHVGDPREHYAANDGLFELATCHGHFHFRNYALYQLIDPRTGKVWRAAKAGFCMLDTDPNPNSLTGDPPRNPQYRSCGDLIHPGNQGISRGWTDTYRFFLGGQYFVLDGGDGQDPVPPGEYIIRITANPAFRARGGEPCRALDSATGLCHNFAESDYTNNVGEVRITIPAHVGREGHGPLAGTEPLGKEPAEH